MPEPTQVFQPARLKGHAFRSLGAYRPSEQQHGELPNQLLPISICTPKQGGKLLTTLLLNLFWHVSSFISAQSLHTYLPPATGKLRNEAWRQTEAAVRKMRSANDLVCRARENRQHAKGLVSYSLHEAKVISHISASCSSPQPALMTTPVFKINGFIACTEGNTVRQKMLLVTKSFCTLFNWG